MALNLTQKIITAHGESGEDPPNPDESIALRIDQTLLQDATGTLAMLAFESLSIPQVKTELSVQYVDHNLIQSDHRNSDDHLFLRSAAQKYGLWFSRPGNGVSHPLHMERFGVPGKTLLGTDSHTPAAGALGMLAIGAGGLDVAMAMAGEPFQGPMPKVWGVCLHGRLPAWVSAKDVILELLRRHDVQAATGYVLEYYGPGLRSLGVMDRHVIANMGTELGATSTVFPSDRTVKDFLHRHRRSSDWSSWQADDGADYDRHEEINLDALEPLIACPSSPDNVVPVREIAGKPIYQCYLGSSANPGLRDFAVPAMMVANTQVSRQVSFDVNPTSRQMLANLARLGYLEKLVSAGARLHQAGCNGCIGMGQAPATGQISLRTVPRNFPGRSGTPEDQVYLCSPETATASALTGRITDPRTLDMPFPEFEEPEKLWLLEDMFEPPAKNHREIDLVKGPNIQPLPDQEPLPDNWECPVLLKVEDNISTDAIMPAGTDVLPYRSNIEKISQFVFRDLDPDYAQTARQHRKNGSLIVAGENYGQGSSREHAALAPKFLGVRAVIAKSFARLHRKNLVNFGILPLTFADPDDYERLGREDILRAKDLRKRLGNDSNLELELRSHEQPLRLKHDFSPREVDILQCGGRLRQFTQG